MCMGGVRYYRLTGRSLLINWLITCGCGFQVFLCTDQETQRDLAVKVVDIDHIERGKHTMDSLSMHKEIRSFETEVQLLRNLHHERIVSYYGTDRKDGKLYIFMEYLPGVSEWVWFLCGMGVVTIGVGVILENRV